MKKEKQDGEMAVGVRRLAVAILRMKERQKGWRAGHSSAFPGKNNSVANPH
jgi:hypothetical protein